MKLSNIECFLTLADTLNYTEASDRLYMTQSALSRIILQMEEELDFPLFTRSRRGVELTPEGHVFRKDCIKLLNDYTGYVNKAKNASNGSMGKIKFNAHINLSDSIILNVIAGFSAEYPNIELNIASSSTSKTLQAIDEGSIDCAICPGTPRDDGAETVLLAQNRECLVVSDTHHFADLESIKLHDAKDENFVVMSRSFSARGYDSVILRTKKSGFTPSIANMANSVPHLLAMVATGRYVTVLSENYKFYANDRIRFIPLTDGYLANFNFIWNPGKNINPSARLMADYVKDHFRIEPAQVPEDLIF